MESPSELLFPILLAHPEGISEFELFQKLIELGHLEKERIDETYSLFQTHFLLFHSLYQLRGSLRQKGLGELEIHCLKIRFLPFSDSNRTEIRHITSDPMEEYYLNPENLQTSPEEIDRNLKNFWEMFAKYTSREEAYALLDLPVGASEEEIWESYRKLVKENHPDKGGDGSRISDLHRAKKSLLG